MILDKKIAAICPIASKEATRPVLGSIYINNGKAIATDGFALIEVGLPKEQTEEDIPDIPGVQLSTETKLLIPAKPLESALKLIPKKASLPILTKAWTAKGSQDNSIKIISTDLTTTNAPEIMQTIGEFPHTEKVKPQTQPQATVSFDPEKMITLLTAMVKAGTNRKGVTIEIREKLQPIVLTSQDDEEKDIYAILMPLNIS